jgi:PKD repeat protein
MTRYFSALLLFTFVFFSAFSQEPDYDERMERLLIISRQRSEQFDIRRKESLEYAVKNQIPVIKKQEDGRVMELQYIHPRGFPVYHTTFNAGAARTVKTNELHPGGVSELELTGKGHSLGIWDAGIVDSIHKEFKGRLFQRNSFTEPDNHATHVAGTMAAEGIDRDAKGMAFEADVISYNWNNYQSEIAFEASRGLLISNQSFGIALGWVWEDGAWKWYGDPDAEEEYRFGFYTQNQSRALDEIAFNAPNLLMVWAAGNSRSGEGDGTREPNGPYDNIGPEAVAKNVLAVGAVEKISTVYTQPADVRMTWFSSWGPSDDGRVKPDLVAPGLQLYSTTPFGNYGTMTGTSVSAPVVSGSLILLQELFHLRHGFPMRSATLRAVAIHTVNETGMNKGPDYRFGWGLLNTSAAGGLIDRDDDVSVIIRELTLQNNEIYEFDIYPDGLSELAATIAWTDPPGTPPPADSINPPDLMLVNDLDIRIRDEAGNVFYPWILDPENFEEPAVRGDNFRDNIEKIFIGNPEPRKYTVTVSHKNELSGGRQDYSIILSTSVISPVESPTLFWIGEEGEWNDPLGWSQTSGGEPAGLIPGTETNVVVDENSFTDFRQTLSLVPDARCRSFSWLVKEENEIVFNGHELFIHGDFLVSRGIFGDPAGRFILAGPEGIVNTGNNEGNPLNLIFDNEEGIWHIASDTRLDRVTIKAGSVHFARKIFHLNYFDTEGEQGKYVSFSGSELHVQGIMDLTGEMLEVDAVDLKIVTFFPESSNQAIIRAENLSIEEIEIISGNLVLEGSMVIEKITNNSLLTLKGSNLITELILEGGSETWMDGGSIQVIREITANSVPGNMVVINSLSLLPATIANFEYIKICLDYLSVYNVSTTGPAVFVAGENSLLTGQTAGWITRSCDEVLFAGFTVEHACAFSVARFIDRSDGDILTWRWDFGDPYNSDDVSNLQNPEYSYEYTGIYLVSLTVTDVFGSAVLQREIDVIENTIAETHITFNSLLNSYASSETAPNYQWYNDGIPIPGATRRTLAANGHTGEIMVLLSDEQCNRFSTSLTVSVDEPVPSDKKVVIYPNPASDRLNIEFSNSFYGSVGMEVFDIAGKVIHSSRFEKNREHSYSVLPTGTFPPGLYIIRITAGKEIIVRNFIKN